MNHSSKRPTLALILCLIGFPQISETIYTPSLPDLATALATTIQKAELTLSIYFVGFALGVSFWGVLADVLGRRRSLLLGILVYLIGSLGCRFSSTIDVLLFCRFVQALGASAGSVVTQTILRDLYTGKERNRVFSIVGAALSLSPALGPFIGGLVDQLYGWKGNFSVLALMGVVLGLCTARFLPETKHLSPHPPRTSPGSDLDSSRLSFWTLLHQMIRNPKLLSFAFLIGACNGIIFSYYAEAPFLFIEVLGISPSSYGTLGLIIAGSFLGASSLYQRLNLRYEFEEIMIIGATLTTFGGLLFCLFSGLGVLSPHPTSWIWVAVLLPIAILFVGIGILIPNCLSNALTDYQSQSGTAGSILGLISYCLIAGFTALMSILHDGTPLIMAVYFTVLGLAMVTVSIWMHSRRLISTVSELTRS